MPKSKRHLNSPLHRGPLLKISNTLLIFSPHARKSRAELPHLYFSEPPLRLAGSCWLRNRFWLARDRMVSALEIPGCQRGVCSTTHHAFRGAAGVWTGRGPEGAAGSGGGGPYPSTTAQSNTSRSSASACGSMPAPPLTTRRCGPVPLLADLPGRFPF